MNSATRKTTTKARRIVTLDESQYQLYQRGQIEIQAPNGEFLKAIGTTMDQAETEVDLYRLQDQLHLVEALLFNTQGQLELNERAVAGLVQVLSDARGFLNR
jgi:hypothetical protein